MNTAYLIGIGGAGLSGLARYLHHNGYLIYGADPSENNVSRALEQDIDATIYSEHAAKNIPDHCDIVVFSPAVPSSNPERVEALKREIPQYTYPEYLGVISQDKKTIAIAGTNGKTTTTTMTATVLDELGLDPTVIVGGVMPRFGSNFRAGESDLFVVEACEYKDSFLSLHPNIVVITNITPDHLDYFGTIENYVDVFVKFIDRIPEGGILVTNPALPYLEPIIARAQARALQIVDYSQYTHHQWQLSVPGQYNIANAAAALTACIQLDLETSQVQKTIETKFQTADRRFQLLGMTTDGAPVYDDYVHNVEGLEALIAGIRTSYPDKKIVLAFQPHEFSRTQLFLEGWVNILSKIDQVYLLPIYQARENPDDFTIRSPHVVEQVMNHNPHAQIKYIESIEEGVTQIEEANYNSDHIIICAGAGLANKIGYALVA